MSRFSTHRGAHAHDGGVNTDGCKGAEDAQDGESTSQSLPPRHQQHCPSAITRLQESRKSEKQEVRVSDARKQESKISKIA